MLSYLQANGQPAATMTCVACTGQKFDEQFCLGSCPGAKLEPDKPYCVNSQTFGSTSSYQNQLFRIPLLPAGTNSRSALELAYLSESIYYCDKHR